MSDVVDALAFWGPSLLISVLVSSAYYWATKSVVQSAHGILGLVGFAYAAVASEFTEFRPPGFWYWPLWLCLLASVASVVLSLSAFPGRRYIHLVHVATLANNALMGLYGVMGISHDWI